MERERDSLPAAVVEAILDAAAAALPGEACGVLLGRGTEVRYARDVPNDAADPEGAFVIPAETVRSMQAEAGAAGLVIVGFWHSHPRGPGSPSREDLANALPGYLYVIADVRTGTVTAWRLREDRLAFEPA